MVGDKAKELIVNKIMSVLSDEYLGMKDKKYYFNSRENGEVKVVCLSLTCPKVIPEFDEAPQSAPTGDYDWSESPAPKAETAFSQEELDTLSTMIEKLNL